MKTLKILGCAILVVMFTGSISFAADLENEIFNKHEDWMKKVLMGQNLNALTKLPSVASNYNISVPPAVPLASQDVINLAIRDLASRLRVSSDEITAWGTANYVASDLYEVNLSHPLVQAAPQGALATSSINPQPYGTYTYTIKATGPVNTDGSSQFMIDQVKYSDGSYDKYLYMQGYVYVPNADRVPLPGKLVAIDQFDKNGVCKDTITYDTSSGKQNWIQSITYYAPDGKIKYVDNYDYHLLSIDPPVGVTDYTNYGMFSQIIVSRVSVWSETDQTDVKTICTFIYRGRPGLEQLVSCYFPDGTTINYRDGLARDVFQKITSVGPNGETRDYFAVIMTFDYKTDDNGNIISTIVKYANGQTKTINGLADAAEMVASYLGGSHTDELQKIAEDYLANIFNPDDAKVSTEEEKGNFCIFTMALKDGSVVRVLVDKTTGQPSFDDPNLEQTVLSARKNIAANMGIDINGVRINGVGEIECFVCGGTALSLPQSSGLYHITASVGNYTLILESSGLDYLKPTYSNTNSFDATAVPVDLPTDITESLKAPIRVMRLLSFVDNTTGRDYVKEAKNQIMALLNPEYYFAIEVNSWNMANNVLNLSMGFIDTWMALNIGSTSMPVTVDMTTGKITIAPAVVDAVTKTRQAVSEKLNTGLSDVHVNSILRLEIEYAANGVFPYGQPDQYIVSASTSQFNFTFTCAGSNLSLTSCVNRKTNSDWLAAARECLKGKVDNAGFTLANWGVDSDNHFFFKFSLGGDDTAIIKMNDDGSIGDIIINRPEDPLLKKAADFVEKKTGSDKCTLTDRQDGDPRLGQGGYTFFTFSVGANDTVEVKIYQDGMVASFTERTSTYDASGKLVTQTAKTEIYAKDGSVSERCTQTDTFSRDSSGKDYKVSTTVNKCGYDAKGRIISTSMSNYTYDPQGHVVTSVTLETKRGYNEDGTLAFVAQRQNICNASGTYSTESNSCYDNTGKCIGRYSDSSQRDVNGKLIYRSGSAIVIKNGVSNYYSLRYDLNSNGDVTYTHVYLQGKEVNDLSGKGLIYSADVFLKLTGCCLANPWIDWHVAYSGPLLEHKTDTQPIDPTKLVDYNRGEVDAQIALRGQVVAAASDTRFTSEMVTNGSQAVSQKPAAVNGGK